MKNFILIAGVFFTLNALATNYECLSEKGKIQISETSNEVKVIFNDHAVMNEVD